MRTQCFQVKREWQAKTQESDQQLALRFESVYQLRKDYGIWEPEQAELSGDSTVLGRTVF